MSLPLPLVCCWLFRSPELINKWAWIYGLRGNILTLPTVARPQHRFMAGCPVSGRLVGFFRIGLFLRHLVLIGFRRLILIPGIKVLLLHHLHVTNHIRVPSAA